MSHVPLVPSFDTLFALLNEPSLSDQTLIFGKEVLQVNKNILASNSQFFRSLWYLEFADKYENPLNFSHLKVSESSFVSFIKIMYGFQVDVTQNNSYDLFYLAHYFMVERLVNQVEQILIKNFHDKTWVEEFVSRADENEDLRAIEFAKANKQKTFKPSIQAQCRTSPLTKALFSYIKDQQHKIHQLELEINQIQSKSVTEIHTLKSAVDGLRKENTRLKNGQKHTESDSLSPV
ncbi:hypothetical protein GEMRC1_002149 [Eukaryota sp. GEM-RC1]